MFFDIDKATDESKLKVKCNHLGCTTDDEYESFAELSFNAGKNILIVGSKKEIFSIFNLPKQRIEKFVREVFDVIKKPELLVGPVVLTTFNQAEINWQDLPVSEIRQSGKIICTKSAFSSKKELQKYKNLTLAASIKDSLEKGFHCHSAEIYELLEELFEEVKEKQTEPNNFTK